MKVKFNIMDIEEIIEVDDNITKEEKENKNMNKEFTRQDLQNFLKDTYKIAYSNIITVLHKRPRLRCNDGFSVSLQASQDHYCSPRINLDDGEYTEVELGYPSQPEEMLRPYIYYIENDDLTKAAFEYVPIDIIVEIIKKHNGINYEETFKNYKK